LHRTPPLGGPTAATIWIVRSTLFVVAETFTDGWIAFGPLIRNHVETD